MSGQLQTTDNGRIIPKSKNADEKALAKMIAGMTDAIKHALPRHVTPERMGRIVLTALRTTKDLHRCSPASFLGSVLSLAQLGLEPNTPLGHAWLIPRNMKKVGWTCTFIVGYQGYIELAYRTGKVMGIYAEVVRDGDVFSFRRGLRPDLIHEPKSIDIEPKSITHAYAVANIRDADPVFEVLNRAQIEARRNRSAAANADISPWKSDWEAMAKKTAVRALHKWIPKAAELSRAVAFEEAPELGRMQSSVFSDEVTEALQSEGLEIIDHETGEVLSEPQERQPGEEG